MVNNPNFPKDSIKTRKIAFLVADGFDDVSVSSLKNALMTAGALTFTVAPRLGVLTGANGGECKADFSFLTGSSVLFDAVYIPGGEAGVRVLKSETEASNFIDEAYKHCKALAATGEGVDLLTSVLQGRLSETNTRDEPIALNQGVVTSGEPATEIFASTFIAAIAEHRHWERERFSITEPSTSGVKSRARSAR